MSFFKPFDSKLKTPLSNKGKSCNTDKSLGNSLSHQEKESAQKTGIVQERTKKSRKLKDQNEYSEKSVTDSSLMDTSIDDDNEHEIDVLAKSKSKSKKKKKRKKDKLKDEDETKADLVKEMECSFEGDTNAETDKNVAEEKRSNRKKGNDSDFEKQIKVSRADENTDDMVESMIDSKSNNIRKKRRPHEDNKDEIIDNSSTLETNNYSESRKIHLAMDKDVCETRTELAGDIAVKEDLETNETGKERMVEYCEEDEKNDEQNMSLRKKKKKKKKKCSSEKEQKEEKIDDEHIKKDVVCGLGSEFGPEGFIDAKMEVTEKRRGSRKKPEIVTIDVCRATENKNEQLEEKLQGDSLEHCVKDDDDDDDFERSAKKHKRTKSKRRKLKIDDDSDNDDKVVEKEVKEKAVVCKEEERDAEEAQVLSRKSKRLKTKSVNYVDEVVQIGNDDDEDDDFEPTIRRSKRLKTNEKKIEFRSNVDGCYEQKRKPGKMDEKRKKDEMGEKKLEGSGEKNECEEITRACQKIVAKECPSKSNKDKILIKNDGSSVEKSADNSQLTMAGMLSHFHIFNIFNALCDS